MTEYLLLGLAGIIVLGIAAQWLAWRLKLPSILLLLIVGFAAGPLAGFINPDELLGDILFPIVSISVAIILFEGGLSLRIPDLRKTGAVVHLLVTVGACVTWSLSALAAYYILDIDFTLAILLGAILVVSGPTVIGPLLRNIRPVGNVASILRWEGILIDPVGAVLAVLVYEVIVAGSFNNITTVAVVSIVKTILVGGGIGIPATLVLIFFLKRFWIPDFLQSPVSLMIVVSAFTASNMLQHESGLLSVTVMGVILANQETVKIKHIIEFKENLRILLISGLFIVLSARITMGDLEHMSVKSLLFLGVLILFVRPLAVAISTLGSELNWRERIFLSFIAPRGIVAAAVSSIFALRMFEAGYTEASQLAPITFMVIIGTVAVYGLGSPLLAKRLGVAEPNPQGVFIVGAQPWAVTIAKVLKDSGFKVFLADINLSNIFNARMEGIPTYYGSIVSESILNKIDLDGIGRLMALTPNDSVNSLATLRFEEVFDSSELYQLIPLGEEKGDKEKVSKHLRGRFLFGSGINYQYLARRFAAGAVVKKTKLTEEFDYEEFKARYGTSAVPLFLVTDTGNLLVYTTDDQPEAKAGHTLISLVDPLPEG